MDLTGVELPWVVGRRDLEAPLSCSFVEVREF